MHAAYGKICLPHIAERLIAGQLKIVDFFEQVRVIEIAEADVARFRDPQIAFMNVNTPDELERARALAAGSAEMARLRPVLLVHYHELGLKRGNRPLFLRHLARNVRRATSDLAPASFARSPAAFCSTSTSIPIQPPFETVFAGCAASRAWPLRIESSRRSRR